MKKGFTLIELLAVIAIMAIILLIAVPVYNGVQTNIKESIYHSKIEEVLAKAEGYASETNSFVFDIKTLIENGSLSADNEAGSFVDPRTNRDMRCDIVNVVYENNQYEASITESETCYEQEELENLFGMVDLVLYKSDGSEINRIEGTDWIKERNIYVGYRFKEAYQSYQDKITEIYWSGEEEKSCQEDLSTCEKYEIVTDQIKNVTIHLEMVFLIDGVEIRSNISKTILVDLQKPSVVEGSIKYDQDLYSNSMKKVEFELTDFMGSGIKAFGFVKNPVCDDEYEEKKQSASGGVETSYLTNGSYYICVEDKVGNIYSDPNQVITISNVDMSGPTITVRDNNIWGKTNKIEFEIEDDTLVNSYGFSETSDMPTSFTYVNEQKISVSNIYNENKTYYIWATDASGNVSKLEFEVKYIDNILPTATIRPPAASAGVNAVTSFTLADNESGLKRYAILESENASPNWKTIQPERKNYSFSQTFKKNGTYYLWVEDVVGNVFKTSFEIKNVDVTPPTFKVEQAMNWVTSDSIKVTITDNESGIYGYAWTTTNVEPTTWSRAYSSKEKVITRSVTQNQTLYLWAKDVMGNVGSIQIVERYIDRTKPVVNYSTPSSWTNTARTITLSATDNESGVEGIYYAFSSNPNSFIKYTSPFTSSENVFYVYAVDNAGNQSSKKTYQTKVDTKKPYTPLLDIELTLEEPTNSSVECSRNDKYSDVENVCTLHSTSRRVNYWFYATDSGSGVAQYYREVYVNGSLRRTDTVDEGEGLPYTNYSVSYYYIKIYAIDAVGNKSSNSLTIHMYFD